MAEKKKLVKLICQNYNKATHLLIFICCPAVFLNIFIKRDGLSERTGDSEGRC